MLRAFFIFLLSLTTFFLGGFQQLAAQAQQKASFYIPAKDNQAVAFARAGLSQINPGFLLSATPTKGAKVHDKIASTENQVEEEESEDVKELLVGDFLPAIYYGFALAFLLGNLQRILRVCKQVASFYFRRWYLLFRVLRI
ncbi:hypothetical protein [Rufibacter psychrotolerans]|uniref:hypothetical protein n=1 Tax=Rufibacter psychrotolerans TaxID=2812556 RepID=UPI00196827B1|nr:hypothetical protein [Rufibacter sp. SYSU D00308]